MAAHLSTKIEVYRSCELENTANDLLLSNKRFLQKISASTSLNDTFFTYVRTVFVQKIGEE